MPDFGSDGISIDTISGIASVTLLGGILGIDVSPKAKKLRIGKLVVEAQWVGKKWGKFLVLNLPIRARWIPMQVIFALPGEIQVKHVWLASY